MLHSIFGSNRPFVLGVLLLPIILLVVLTGIYLEPSGNELGGPLFDWLMGYLGDSKWLLLLCGMVVNLTSASVLNFASNGHSFNRKENFFPALVFLLFGSINLTWWYLNPVSIAILFFLLALRRLLRIYRVQAVTGNLFDVGFFLAMGALFFPPMILTFPLIWMSLLQLRAFDFREWLVPITGLLIPFIYTGMVYFFNDFTFDASEFLAVEDGLPNSLVPEPGVGFTALSIFTFVLAAIGSFIFITNMRVSTVHKKNAKKVMVWSTLFLVITLFYGLLLTEESHFILLISIPIAISLGDFFLSDKRQVIVLTAFYVWVIAAFCYPLFASIF